MDYKINLNRTPSDIQKFIDMTFSFVEDIDIKTIDNRYILDAKSVMGVLSLDLSKPVIVTIHSDDIETLTRFKEAISTYEID